MDSFGTNNENKDSLPPPSYVVPVKAEPEKEKVLRVPMARPGFGRKGIRRQLLTNYFKVNIRNIDGYFYEYRVSFSHGHGSRIPVESQGVRRKLLQKIQETPNSALEGNDFVYNGEGTLFTLSTLGRRELEFPLVLGDVTLNRNNANTYKVDLSYVSKIPFQAITEGLHGQKSQNFQKAIRVLALILRDHAAKQGCLLVGQSFLHHDERYFYDIGRGVSGCMSFYPIFKSTQSGLYLNADILTTTIITPGPVVEFLLLNQNISNPTLLDWGKAESTLRNRTIKISTSNQEFKITGISEFPCKDQMFRFKARDGSGRDYYRSVYHYFVNHKRIHLSYSWNLPCINVGKPGQETYFPIELCFLKTLQLYKKDEMSEEQITSLAVQSAHTPRVRAKFLTETLTTSNYVSQPMLRNCGVNISLDLTKVEGRLLRSPCLRVGDGENVRPQNGSWNFEGKEFYEPAVVLDWGVLNFSVLSRTDINVLLEDLKETAKWKGIDLREPGGIFSEENDDLMYADPFVRVEKLFNRALSELTRTPRFLLCLLPKRKNTDLYGPIKKAGLAMVGVVTQCIVPTCLKKGSLTSVVLKMNAKLGGLNSLLADEFSRTLPVVSSTPTVIIGVDVCQGPTDADMPSIAAVVSSREWPHISKYRAYVRTLPPRVEIIHKFFEKVSENVDNGIMREILHDFCDRSTVQNPPQNIIIFRDGVGESQFGQVLNLELDQITKACKFYDQNWNPKFLVIVAQKIHRTRFFQFGSHSNIQHGTVVDKEICHPENYDFYLCAQAAYAGTAMPTHYHVLLGEIGFSIDDLEELVHSLSYVYQRGTTAISGDKHFAPIRYAHLAAAQMSEIMQSEQKSETSSSHGGVPAPPVLQLPRLHDNVSSSMFFC